MIGARKGVTGIGKKPQLVINDNVVVFVHRAMVNTLCCIQRRKCHVRTSPWGYCWKYMALESGTGPTHDISLAVAPGVIIKVQSPTVVQSNGVTAVMFDMQLCGQMVT